MGMRPSAGMRLSAGMRSSAGITLYLAEQLFRRECMNEKTKFLFAIFCVIISTCVFAGILLLDIFGVGESQKELDRAREINEELRAENEQLTKELKLANAEIRDITEIMAISETRVREIERQLARAVEAAANIEDGTSRGQRISGELAASLGISIGICGEIREITDRARKIIVENKKIIDAVENRSGGRSDSGDHGGDIDREGE
ncbi:MAG: hypothetical protein GF311_28110 [Candidatus Lokiarchaeota archaeon]|nr:hypothetical protein [Candidatus Lokiarchaeota archaeon]